jgi:hypothetical protein
MFKPKSLALLAGAVAGALLAGPASADVIFQVGNFPQPDEQNILFVAPETWDDHQW